MNLPAGCSIGRKDESQKGGSIKGLELPVATENHKFLTQTYGDYMQMPPECDRVIKHVLKVDFGRY